MPRITLDDIIETCWENANIQTWEEGQKFLKIFEKMLDKEDKQVYNLLVR